MWVKEMMKIKERSVKTTTAMLIITNYAIKQCNIGNILTFITL